MTRLSTSGSLCGRTCLAGVYLDGELPAGQIEKFMRHLETCAACRREVRTLRRLSQLLRTWGQPGPWETGPEDEPARRPEPEVGRGVVGNLDPGRVPTANGARPVRGGVVYGDV